MTYTCANPAGGDGGARQGNAFRQNEPVETNSQVKNTQAPIVRNADGSTEGADPRRIGRDRLEAAGHPGGPLLKVIRAKCLDCSYGQHSEVARCTAIGCALWPYRMGTNPFTGRKGNPAAL